MRLRRTPVAKAEGSELLWEDGASPTDYTYTGQRSLSDIGLMDYNARFYDPGLGKFTQTDYIFPIYDYDNWNLYDYTHNNPVMYSDPTGNFPFWVFLVTVVVSFVLTSDQAHPEDPEPLRADIPKNYGVEDFECYSTLPDCFGDTVLLKDFSDNNIDNPIPTDEFEDFLDEVAVDLYSHDLSWPGYTTGRGIYDTPFYNNGGRGTNNPEGDFDADQEVCIESIGCYARSEINYVAQGMWGAATNEPEYITEKITEAWKFTSYKGETPSEGTYFWLHYGYDYYNNYVEENH